MVREAGSSGSSTVPPRWATKRNPLRPTYGPAVVAAARELGAPLMPHQVLAVTVGLEVQSVEAGDPEPGAFAYDEVGVSMQRRGGKTYTTRVLVAHRMRTRTMARIWSTAQTGKHARRRFLDLSESLVRSPIGSGLRRHVGVNHEQLTMLETGSTLEPFSPNADAIHGDDADLVIGDELWAFDAEQARVIRQAYLPAFGTTNGQAWLFSTAGTEESAWLNGLRRRGRAAVEAGRQLGLAWFEWGLPDEVDGIPVEDLDDEALIEACIRYHPATGYTLRPGSVRASWATMTEEDPVTGRLDFLRAWGNRTPSSGKARTIPAHLWDHGRTEEKIPDDARVVLGAAVEKDGSEAAIAAAAMLPDGRRIVEVVDALEGASWLLARGIQLAEKHSTPIAGNDAGPTRELLDVLELAGVPVYRIPERDYAAACVRVERELRDGSWRHRGQSSLNDAAAGTGKRRLGGSWAWANVGSPIAALEAATVAAWGLDHVPVPEDEGSFWIG